MTAQGQGSGKKCLHPLGNGNMCDKDAISGTNYCEDHGPKSSGRSSSHSGSHSGKDPFATGSTMYKLPFDPDKKW